MHILHRRPGTSVDCYDHVRELAHRAGQLYMGQELALARHPERLELRRGELEPIYVGGVCALLLVKIHSLTDRDGVGLIFGRR